jgi:hypothetical protein
MSDSVKFIFKTLIKVPVTIAIAFLVFNIFSWTISYFKLNSASYIVMQVGLENNYIPPNEELMINSYLKSLESDILTDVRIGGESTYNRKRQYGEKLTVGVSANLRFIWPLMHNEQYAASNSPDKYFGDAKSKSELSQDLKSKESEGNINIIYTIPGMQHYSDID